MRLKLGTFVLFLLLWGCDDGLDDPPDLGVDADILERELKEDDLIDLEPLDLADLVDQDVGQGDLSDTPQDLQDQLDMGDQGADQNDSLDQEGDLIEVEESGTLLYPSEAIQSPMSPAHVGALGEVFGHGAGQEDVFMKVGASGTVSQSFFYCFANEVTWSGYEDLSDSWSHFLGGNANDGGAPGPLTPYDRPTYAAEVGRTAAWVMEGDPSPVQREAAAIHPGFALLNYGTNDMNMGTTHLSALWGYYESYSDLMDWTMGEGIVPIITGILARNDSAEADLWVSTYNAVIRGMAQSRGLPFVDLELALRELPDRGLSGDGLHANTSPGGACDFSAEGLEYGYNQRNLITMVALDRARRATLLGEVPDGPQATYLEGQGTVDDPYLIDSLPFSHMADTSDAPSSIDTYTGCNATQDESGGEVYYKLLLDQDTALRMLVLDRGEDDLDIHLLSSPEAQHCMERDHRVIEGTLSSGEWWIVVDSWVNNSGAIMDGPFLLTLLACDDGDTRCAAALN